jgi:hypothetical protein
MTLRSKSKCDARSFVRIIIFLKPDCDSGIIREMRAHEQKQRTKKKRTLPDKQRAP